jgi:metal-responsive CopG/Arc/MetJ family transcriptional regulator
MKPIQILMDEEMIAAIDREAKRRKLDRSKLLRAAVVDYLANQRRREREKQDRRGYAGTPQKKEEYEPWLVAQVWPED